MNLPNKLRFAISKAGLAGLRRKLILTYDNTKMTDGAGAQLQRIYGTYSVARLVGAAYLHAPLGRVDYQGLSALESNLTDPAFIMSSAISAGSSPTSCRRTTFTK